MPSDKMEDCPGAVGSALFPSGPAASDFKRGDDVFTGLVACGIAAARSQLFVQRAPEESTTASSWGL